MSNDDEKLGPNEVRFKATPGERVELRTTHGKTVRVEEATPAEVAKAQASQRPSPCRLVMFHYNVSATQRVARPAVVTDVHDDGTVDLHVLVGPNGIHPAVDALVRVPEAPRRPDGTQDHSDDARSPRRSAHNGTTWWTWPPRA